MIKAEIGSDTFVVWFHHTQFPTPLVHTRGNYDKVEIKAETECHIVKGPKDNAMEVARGHARVAVDDRFSKEKGRLISFRRAVDQVFPSLPENKEARKALWQAYVTRKRG